MLDVCRARMLDVPVSNVAQGLSQCCCFGMTLEPFVLWEMFPQSPSVKYSPGEAQDEKILLSATSIRFIISTCGSETTEVTEVAVPALPPLPITTGFAAVDPGAKPRERVGVLLLAVVVSAVIACMS